MSGGILGGRRYRVLPLRSPVDRRGARRLQSPHPALEPNRRSVSSPFYKVPQCNTPSRTEIEAEPPPQQNPTTITIPERWRDAISSLARRHNVPIIEDDAYGFIPTHGSPAFATMASDICWHIAGLAKCIGAGLRLAYVVAPDARSGWSFNSAMRALTVMASPVAAAVATRWIEDGTVDTILRFIRAETMARQRITARILEPGSYLSDPLSLNLWLPLRNGWTRSVFASHVRSTGLGVIVSDAFTAGGPPPEAVRVGLGGPVMRSQSDGVVL